MRKAEKTFGGSSSSSCLTLVGLELENSPSSLSFEVGRENTEIGGLTSSAFFSPFKRSLNEDPDPEVDFPKGLELPEKALKPPLVGVLMGVELA